MKDMNGLLIPTYDDVLAAHERIGRISTARRC